MQGSVLAAREGFYHRSIWFSLLAEMIGLYPHPGYLLAWPSRQVVTPGFSHIPWDSSGTGGFTAAIVMVFSLFLAVAVFFRRRWAGYIAAAVGFLVAAVQYQQVHFLHYSRSGHLSFMNYYDILDNSLRTGAFEKLTASVVSALLALTLVRVLRSKNIIAQVDAPQTASMSTNRFAHNRGRKLFLFGALIFSAMTLPVLAWKTPLDWGAYMGAESGFSAVFELLLLVPVGIGAVGVWLTSGRFFVGLSAGYAALFPTLLVEAWFLELRNPVSPIHGVKGLVWTAVIVCLGVLAASILMACQTTNPATTDRGKFSFGVIVALAFFVASLDACHLHYIGTTLLRN